MTDKEAQAVIEAEVGRHMGPVMDAINKVESRIPDTSGLATLHDIETFLEKTKPAEPAAAAKPTPEAEMEEGGILAGAMGIKPLGIPLGEAAVGGVTAILISEVVDGLMTRSSKNWRGVAKLGAAAAVARYGKKVFGTQGKTVVALLLTFDAIRDVTPLDDWANNIANKVTGVIPVGGLGDQRGPGVINQAEKVATDYYSSAEGRR